MCWFTMSINIWIFQNTHFWIILHNIDLLSGSSYFGIWTGCTQKTAYQIIFVLLNLFRTVVLISMSVFCVLILAVFFPPAFYWVKLLRFVLMFCSEEFHLALKKYLSWWSLQLNQWNSASLTRCIDNWMELQWVVLWVQPWNFS